MDASLREEITERTNIMILGKAGRITGKHFRAVFLYFMREEHSSRESKQGSSNGGTNGHVKSVQKHWTLQK